MRTIGPVEAEKYRQRALLEAKITQLLPPQRPVPDAFWDAFRAELLDTGVLEAEFPGITRSELELLLEGLQLDYGKFWGLWAA
jgi:hypothetical protein